MKDNQTDNIRVFTALEVSKESSYFCFSSKDRISKVVRVVGSKQVFFEALINKTRFPVLKACRILRRLDDNDDTSSDNNNNNNNNTSSIEEYKMDPIEKMITTTTDGNQDANFPSTVQANNNGSTPDATADDDIDDDATVQTSNSNSTKQAWMSFNIKLLLTSKQDTSNNALQYAMLSVLETIDKEVGNHVKIFDGNKQQVIDFQFQEVTTF
jgi:hypothetical protein